VETGNEEVGHVNGKGDYGFLTYRTIRYYGSFHVERTGPDANGPWALAHVYLSRVDNALKEASYAAKNAIKEKLLEAWKKQAQSAEFVAALHEGERKHLEREIEQLDGKIKEKREDLAVAEARRDKLAGELSRL
jgi:hypothetical protein